MTVEANLLAVLTSIVSGRVFPDFAPGGTVTPYATYQQVGGQSPIFLERAVPSKENGRFQVSIWAPTRSVCKTLIKQVEAAMVAATTFEAKPVGAPIALTDDDTQLRGASQDFVVWSDR